MRTLLSLLLTLSVLAAPRLGAQDSDLGNWIIYLGNKSLGDRWNLHHEVQYRNYNFVGDLEQLLLRAGVGYDVTDNFNVLLGYGYINSQNYVDPMSDKQEVNEHRIYQQLVTRQQLGRVGLQHRYRFEERFVENKDIGFRFRYFLSLNVPLTNREMTPKTFYLSAYNEIFVTTEDNPFDRNRLYGGLGYVASPGLRFEVGYMNQYFANGGRDQLNLITSASF